MKAANNMFSDGLNTDLHPLNINTTTITDALNATLVTFNGNEAMMQNDMGNTLIQDSLTGSTIELSEGFVPVGMVEHGGILYIASKNKTTGEGELGSVPSPMITYDYVGTSFKENSEEFVKLFGSLDDYFDFGENSSYYGKLINLEYKISDLWMSVGDGFIPLIDVHPKIFIERTLNDVSDKINFNINDVVRDPIVSSDKQQKLFYYPLISNDGLTGLYNLYPFIKTRNGLKVVLKLKSNYSVHYVDVDNEREIAIRSRENQQWFMTSENGKSITDITFDKRNLTYSRYPNVPTGQLFTGVSMPQIEYIDLYTSPVSYLWVINEDTDKPSIKNLIVVPGFIYKTDNPYHIDDFSCTITNTDTDEEINYYSENNLLITTSIDVDNEDSDKYFDILIIRNEIFGKNFLLQFNVEDEYKDNLAEVFGLSYPCVLEFSSEVKIENRGAKGYAITSHRINKPISIETTSPDTIVKLLVRKNNIVKIKNIEIFALDDDSFFETKNYKLAENTFAHIGKFLNSKSNQNISDYSSLGKGLFCLLVENATTVFKFDCKFYSKVPEVANITSNNNSYEFINISTSSTKVNVGHFIFYYSIEAGIVNPIKAENNLSVSQRYYNANNQSEFVDLTKIINLPIEWEEEGKEAEFTEYYANTGIVPCLCNCSNYYKYRFENEVRKDFIDNNYDWYAEKNNNEIVEKKYDGYKLYLPVWFRVNNYSNYNKDNSFYTSTRLDAITLESLHESINNVIPKINNDITDKRVPKWVTANSNINFNDTYGNKSTTIKFFAPLVCGGHNFGLTVAGCNKVNILDKSTLGGFYSQNDAYKNIYNWLNFYLDDKRENTLVYAPLTTYFNKFFFETGDDKNFGLLHDHKDSNSPIISSYQYDLYSGGYCWSPVHAFQRYLGVLLNVSDVCTLVECLSNDDKPNKAGNSFLKNLNPYPRKYTKFGRHMINFEDFLPNQIECNREKYTFKYKKTGYLYSLNYEYQIPVIKKPEFINSIDFLYSESPDIKINLRQLNETHKNSNSIYYYVIPEYLFPISSNYGFSVADVHPKILADTPDVWTYLFLESPRIVYGNYSFNDIFTDNGGYHLSHYYYDHNNSYNKISTRTHNEAYHSYLDSFAQTNLFEEDNGTIKNLASIPYVYSGVSGSIDTTVFERFLDSHLEAWSYFLRKGEDEHFKYHYPTFKISDTNIYNNLDHTDLLYLPYHEDTRNLSTQLDWLNTIYDDEQVYYSPNIDILSLPRLGFSDNESLYWLENKNLNLTSSTPKIKQYRINGTTHLRNLLFARQVYSLLAPIACNFAIDGINKSTQYQNIHKITWTSAEKHENKQTYYFNLNPKLFLLYDEKLQLLTISPGTNLKNSVASKNFTLKAILNDSNLYNSKSYLLDWFSSPKRVWMGIICNFNPNITEYLDLQLKKITSNIKAIKKYTYFIEKDDNGNDKVAELNGELKAKVKIADQNNQESLFDGNIKESYINNNDYSIIKTLTDLDTLVNEITITFPDISSYNKDNTYVFINVMAYKSKTAAIVESYEIKTDYPLIKREVNQLSFKSEKSINDLEPFMYIYKTTGTTPEEIKISSSDYLYDYKGVYLSIISVPADIAAVLDTRLKQGHKFYHSDKIFDDIYYPSVFCYSEMDNKCFEYQYSKLYLPNGNYLVRGYYRIIDNKMEFTKHNYKNANGEWEKLDNEILKKLSNLKIHD